MPEFKSTAYQDLNNFVYARAKYPVALKNGMVIGGGTLYPEVNFTLPTMNIDESTMPEVIRNYREIITGICERAKDLHSPGLWPRLNAAAHIFEPKASRSANGGGHRERIADVRRKSAGASRPTTTVRAATLTTWRGCHWDAMLKRLRLRQAGRTFSRWNRWAARKCTTKPSCTATSPSRCSLSRRWAART